MIGPTLPPHLRKDAADQQERAEDDNDDAEEDAYGPALPPSLAARRGKPSAPAPVPSPPRQEVHKHVEDDESSDDEIGPRPPAPSTSRRAADDGVREFLERERRRKELAEEGEKNPKPLQREAWMLAPPTASEALASLDPTRIKNRQFSRATGREAVSKDTTLWTETPAERQKRLEEELSGKRKRVTSGINEEEEEALRKRRRMQEDLGREIDAHNKMARGPSLLEVHQSAQASNPDPKDDVIWDRERDMGSAGKLLDQRQRSKMIAEAKGLGERFGSGKRGKYDN